MAGNGIIGALLVSAGMDTADLETGVATSMAAMGVMQKDTEKKSAIIGAAIAAGLAVAGAAFAGLAQQTLTAADDVGDAAARIGTSATEFQKLQSAAVAAGGTPELMTTAMDKLNQGLGAFIQTGAGPAANAFKSLGLGAKIASGEISTADEAFYAAATALEGIEDPAQKAAISMQLFGRAAGVDMLEVTAAGGAALRQFGNDAQATGRIMSDDMIARLADAKLEIDKTKFAFNQFATVLTGEAILAISGFVDVLRPTIEQGKQLAGQVFNFLAPSFQELGSAISALMSGPFGQALLATLRAVAAVAGGALVGAIKIAVEAVALFARTIDSLSRTIVDVPAQFMRMGRQIVEGLVRGFSDAGRIALNAVRELGDQVMTAFRTVLGIRSPSRVFMEYGEFISQGLAIGIRGRSGEAVAAMQSLADELKGIWQDLLTEEERSWMTYVERRNALNRGVQSGLLSPEQAAELRRRDETRRDQDAAKAFREGMTEFEVKRPANDTIRAPTLVIPDEALKRLQDGMAQAANDNEEFYNGVRQTFRDGFRAALDGDLGDFVREWWKDRIASAMEDALNQLADLAADWFSNVLKNGGFGGGTGQGGGNILSGIGNIFKSFFGGGARANGGPVMAGRPYLVGERGPEPFIPSTSGYIQRNGDLHGGGRGSVINIYADRSVVANDIRQMIGQAMVATGRGAHDATINTLTNRAGRRFG